MQSSTDRDDSAVRRIAVHSPSSSCKEIKARLIQSVTNGSLQFLSMRISQQFGLKSRKSAAKPLFTSAMKKKRLTFSKHHQYWKTEDWSKVRFSDEFNFRKHYVHQAVWWKVYRHKYEASPTSNDLGSHIGKGNSWVVPFTELNNNEWGEMSGSTQKQIEYSYASSHKWCVRTWWSLMPSLQKK